MTNKDNPSGNNTCRIYIRSADVIASPDAPIGEEDDDLMPEAADIGKLRMQGLSDEAIAKAIGVPRTAFDASVRCSSFDTLLNVIVAGSFTTSRHYYPMCVQPS